MQLSRRSFLKGVTASAVLSSAHVLGVASRAAAATGPDAPVLVLVNLAGGNDLLNTVVPTDGVQRSLYQALRPDLALPLPSLATLSIHPDPALGTGLALHPSLAGLKPLYDEGRVAVVLGAGIANNSLSHFEAEKARFFGRPDVLVETTGWVGRQLDLDFDGRPHAVSFGGLVSPVFETVIADALGLRSVDGFDLPDDPLVEFRDGTARAAALREILDESRSDEIAERIARSGRTLLEQTAFLAGIPTRGWGSALEGESFGPGRDLREIASLLRHDAQHPEAGTGFCFYQVRVPGYDTHSRQGALDPNASHPRLLSDLSRWLSGFQRDLEAIGASERVVTVVYSEFGRRAAQNAQGADAGTEHGAGGLMLLLGERVVGGVHGRLPRLDQLDATGSLAVTTDFRTVYTALIEDFFGGDAAVLPFGPFAKLPVIQPA
jgi:uncharacterized protein (DUF1501 family)